MYSLRLILKLIMLVKSYKILNIQILRHHLLNTLTCVIESENTIL